MKASDIIVTCLPSKDALQEVICGPAGLERHARSGQIVIDSTTAPLSVKARLRDILAEHGVVMLDCPISGRPDAVRARQAAVFVSGDEDAARLCGPVFDAITDRYSYLGSFGAGTKMKFIANLLVAVHSMAAAEAVEIGTRAGFSVQNIVTALGDTAAWSEQFHIRAPVLANAQPSPNTSASIMFLRDMRVIDDFVTELGSVAPLFSTALSYLEQAERAGYGGRDRR